MAEKKFSAMLGEREITFQTGKLALQANASVFAQLGGTQVLATVVMPEEAREDVGYFPLMVDYEEKLYAAGKIKGSRFIKIEGRPTDEAVLSARLIDRVLRPLFPKWLKNDVQVIISVLSFDKEVDPDMVGINAAAAALMISNIPWNGPIAGCRVAYTSGAWVVNPSYVERDASDMNLVVAGTVDKTLMIEADAKEIIEHVVEEGILFAQTSYAPVLACLEKMQKEIGVEKVAAPLAEEVLDEPDGSTVDYMAEAEKMVREHAPKVLVTGTHETKSSRKKACAHVITLLDEALLEMQVGKERRKKACARAYSLLEAEVSRAIIADGTRVDGRALDEIRPLFAEVGLLARTHGSALFSRGETQVLSVVTLDSPGAAQIMDTLEEDDTKKQYFHHYNFPPFSVGEARPLRGQGRREIGHGMLAEKAIVPMLPGKEEFPYTIRVVSEVLGSNGSSSMASVCGSTLSLLDAGVPLKKPVAGIAMGLASNENGDYKVLTDLQDLEDGEGGMDFKVAGTRDGITAIQLDTKTAGLSNAILKETLAQAHTARMQVLDVMQQAIAGPKEMSQYAPRITSMKIHPDKIRIVIGSGGKTINEIIDQTGVQIDIDDDGLVMITSTNADGAKAAQARIEALTHIFTVGEQYTGKVVRIMDFGAFVELLPGSDGMVHISKLANERVEKVEDVVNLGDTLAVEIDEIDDQGRINLRVQGVEKKPGQERGSRPMRRSGPPRGNGFRPRR